MGDEASQMGLGEHALKHPCRRLIVLALRAEGPMAPVELLRSPMGKGTPPNSYSYHFKELHRLGVLERLDSDDRSDQATRYTVAGGLSQAEIDAAALAAVS